MARPRYALTEFVTLDADPRLMRCDHDVLLDCGSRKQFMCHGSGPGPWTGLCWRHGGDGCAKQCHETAWTRPVEKEGSPHLDDKSRAMALIGAQFDEAVDRIRQVLPHFRIAMSMAAIDVPGGQIMISISGKREDGSGKMVCDFEAEAFVSDLELLVGPASKDDDA
jgi:hypothetical protein